MCPHYFSQKLHQANSLNYFKKGKIVKKLKALTGEIDNSKSCRISNMKLRAKLQTTVVLGINLKIGLKIGSNYVHEGDHTGLKPVPDR